MPVWQREEVQKVLRRQRRIIVPLAITGFWLVMMGIFLYREYGHQSPAPTPDAQSAFVPRDQWMGIYTNNDRRVGYIHMRTFEEKKGEETGQTLQLDAVVETALFGVKAGMDIGGEAWVARNGNTARFEFALSAGDTEMGVRGNVAEGRLQGTLDTGGESVPLDFPVSADFDLASAAGLPSDRMPVLEVGESTKVQAFDPMAMKPAQAVVTCVGEESIFISGEPVPAKLYDTVLGSLTSRSWVGVDGDVLQAGTPFGLLLRKIDPKELAETVVAGEDVDLIRQLAIVSTGVPVVPNASRLVLRVSGVAPDKLPDEPPYQRRNEDVLTLTRPGVPPMGVDAPAQEDLTTYLGSDPFVTADHPDIVAEAQRIVGEETDPWKQVVLLHDWLFEEIEKTPVLSVPNALDVLRTREGDCNEHTVLFTALARARAIPARIAIGLVHSEVLDGFGYHAWPEVYVAGQWHPLDPTLGQLAADATHVKLLNGSIAEWVRLVDFIGQMRIEVLESA